MPRAPLRSYRGLNIAAASPEALRTATSFVYFHWGITPWAVYALTSIAMCWHFYVRKNPQLKLSALLANILGIKQNHVLDKTIDVIFLFSSFAGLSAGMSKLAKLACVLCFVFAVAVLLFGIFVTKISRGRTIRQVVLGLVAGGCVGTWFFFGCLSGFAIEQFISGAVDVPAFLSDGAGEAGVLAVIQQLPLGNAFAIFYFLLMLVFLASHMDATAFTISAVSTKIDSENPSRYLKVFWCIMLGLIPCAMLYINADLNTLKMAVCLTAAPFLVILAIAAYGLVKWIGEKNENN